MLVLGIETSCDDTGVALYHQQQGLLGHQLYSQIEMHQPFGGVVPEIASREHAKRIVTCYDALLSDTAVASQEIDAVAYTAGPGLMGALMVGACFGHSFAMAKGIDKIAVNHLEGHLFSCWLPKVEPVWPCLLLLVSGGHTALVYAQGLGQYQILGQTLDDAAGEAFDKTAKLMGLPYPGGVHLSKLAQQGDAKRFVLPMPLKGKAGLNFSFSGLKSAAFRVWQSCAQTSQDRADLAASFQAIVVEVLLQRVSAAMTETQCYHLLVAGGVSANHLLRTRLSELVLQKQGSIQLPALSFCTDNGAMIAAAGCARLAAGARSSAAITLQPRWALDALAC